MTEWTQAPRVGRTRAGGLPTVTGPRHLMRELVHNSQAIQSITPYNVRWVYLWGGQPSDHWARYFGPKFYFQSYGKGQGYKQGSLRAVAQAKATVTIFPRHTCTVRRHSNDHPNPTSRPKPAYISIIRVPQASRSQLIPFFHHPDTVI